MDKLDRRQLRHCVPVINSGGRPAYVPLSSVPQPWQDELRDIIRREQVPIFSLEGRGDCMFVWDWSSWLDDELFCPF
ncbi:hypothetical protein DDF84_028445 [Cupriavidus metallidurans]|mgnify:CR=1|jgi:hypothetical protein|uniref:Uncharacterized protein n=1 Tax=Cupriavidus metallidurans TaxID=119219 RepID=A0A482IYL9_9BURK|nr:hypothetical protein DDF84_028445 [Cupriavidus metallidurans]